MDREQLLYGLYYVKERVDKVFGMNQRKSQLEAQFRQEVAGFQNKGASGTLKSFVIFAGAASILFEIFLMLAFANLRDEVFGLFVATAAGYVVLVPKFLNNTLRKTKLTIAACISLFVGSMGGAVSFAMAGPLGMILLVVFAAIAVPIYVGIVKKHKAVVDYKNEQIRMSNARVYSEVDKCDAVIRQCQAELKAETNTWFPTNYCYKDAVEWFVTAVENYRCDSVKELIREFELDVRHRQIMQSQADLRRSMENGFNQVINNQQEMNRLLRVNNALAAANVTATIQNTRAVERNTSAVNHVSSQINSAMGVDTIF